MKRVLKLTGTDGETSVEIVAKISTKTSLTKGEAARMTNDFADDLMRTIPMMRYSAIPLSRVKVK